MMKKKLLLLERTIRSLSPSLNHAAATSPSTRMARRILLGLGLILGLGLTYPAYGLNIILVGNETVHAQYTRYADYLDSIVPTEWTVTRSNGTYGLELTPQQVGELNAYDLVIIPRLGMTVDTSWNAITSGMLVHTPFQGANLGMFEATSTGANAWMNDATHYLTHGAPTDISHPILDGVTVESDLVRIYDPVGNGTTVRRQAQDYNNLTAGFVIRTVEGEPTGGAGNQPDGQTVTDFPFLALWEGHEGTYHLGEGAGTIAGARSLFLYGTTNTDNHIGPNGQQLLLNTMEWTATIPEPATISLWMGLGIVSSILVIRRRRRRT